MSSGGPKSGIPRETIDRRLGFVLEEARIQFRIHSFPSWKLI